MIITDTTELCQSCKKKQAVILCDGCGIYLCIDCRKFDLWGYGCGHVDTRVFCPTCFDDIEINPYSEKIDEKNKDVIESVYPEEAGDVYRPMKRKVE